MAGFSGSTGVPIKQMQDAISQSTASLSYQHGDTFSTSAYYLAHGFVTGDSGTIYLMIDVYKNMGGTVTASGITVTSLNGALRGISGYVDGSNSGIQFVNNSAYTVSVVSINTRYSLTITIAKKSGQFTNVANNTPVEFLGTVNLTF